jgi:hypothetical protein
MTRVMRSEPRCDPARVPLGADQARRIVDSLMRCCPIGSFLICKVSPDTASSAAFYDFPTGHHARG